MNKKNQTPGSFEEVRQHFFKKIWTWISGKSIGCKIAFGIGVVLMLFVLARFSFFGEPYYKYSRIVFPFHISHVDEEIPIIPLIFGYEIEDERGRRTGKLGDTLFSGEKVIIYFKAGIPCWITVFGIDSNKEPFPVFKKKLDPSKIKENNEYKLSFNLNDTTGDEAYYAIAASEEFDFPKEIGPFLDNIFSQFGQKGAVFSEYQLELPEKFTQEFVYFNHLPRRE